MSCPMATPSACQSGALNTYTTGRGARTSACDPFGCAACRPVEASPLATARVCVDEQLYATSSARAFVETVPLSLRAVGHAAGNATRKFAWICVCVDLPRSICVIRVEISPRDLADVDSAQAWKSSRS